MGISSEEFRKRRRDLGLTQEALARRLDITLRAVTLIESKGEVPERYVLALAGIEAERRGAEV
jgi:predicted transcriptional regulator